MFIPLLFFSSESNKEDSAMDSGPAPVESLLAVVPTGHRAESKARDPASSTSSDHGDPLLPQRMASLISLATRSTNLAIQLGTRLGGCGLNVAKHTALSTIELSRSVLENILYLAGKDVVSSTESELARAETETTLQKAIEFLHSSLNNAAFWTAAGFNMTSATLSLASETSQFALTTIDRFFGSTDSSRAIASIIALVRREFQNPATGAPGERVSVTDLVMVFCGLAYLQTTCRQLLEEEARAFRTEEVVWDVVVPITALQLDSRANDYSSALSHAPILAALQRRDAHEDETQRADSVLTMELEREIMRALPSNAKVAINRESFAYDIIRVDVISDDQPAVVRPPPGIELVEQSTGLAVTDSARQGASERPGRHTRYVFRRERHHEMRTTSFQQVDGNVNFIDSCELDQSNYTRPSSRLISDREASETFPPFGSDAESKVSSCMPSTLPSSSRDSFITAISNPSVPCYPSNTSSPGVNRSMSSSTRQGLQTVVRKSPSLLDMNDLSTRFPTSSNKQHALSGTWTVSEGAQHSSYRLDPSSQLSMPYSGDGLSVLSSEGNVENLRRAPVKRSPSVASFVTIRESVRQSTISLAETYSMTEDPRASMLEEMDESSWGGKDANAIARTDHRRMKSYTPSIYTLAADAGDASVVSYQGTVARTAFGDDSALDKLKQNGVLDGMFPHNHLVRNITRYMRFASASYGLRFLQFLGIGTKMPPLPSDLRDTHQELRSFAHHTRSNPSDILLSSFVDPNGGSDSSGSTNTGVPLVHYISLDHESKAVVLTCRGTLGFEDVLADMTCDYDDMLWRGRTYKVHKGVHASARRLLYGGDGKVLATLRTALEEFPDYGLVLTGHSLGGAVTTLLGIMLAEPAQSPGTPFVTTAEPHTRYITHPSSTQTSLVTGQPITTPHVCLPAGRAIHVFAYGPPATISPALRDATRGLITTIVNGHDIVPYLSLGVLHDMQAAALALKSDSSAARAELWKKILKGLMTEAAKISGFGSGSNSEEEQRTQEWAYALLKGLRASMVGEKLVPPGEVFVVEAEKDKMMRGGRKGKNVVLKYVRDVEKRFREVRLGKCMLVDHNPGRYERALEGLTAGVMGQD